MDGIETRRIWKVEEVIKQSSLYIMSIHDISVDSVKHTHDLGDSYGAATSKLKMSKLERLSPGGLLALAGLDGN